MGSKSSPTLSTSLPTTKVVILYFSLLAFGSTSVWGLQVSPNSGCASVCMNDPTQDPSDPNTSYTDGSDIVCQDNDYTSTSTGQKFETCLNCLQNSTAVDSGENDLAWYLYNLRYGFNACLFGTTNATDPITTPCSLDTACGPLQGAMTDGMNNPATLQQYSYCSAYDNSFVGDFLGACSQCLQETNNAVIFSNYLTALHAGCLQQPEPGGIIGLNSTVFTTNQVQITSPKSNTSHKAMTTGVIIGIAIGGSVLVLTTFAILFICWKKRHNASRLHRLNSPLDSRFGAKNITAPNRGAFASPSHSPPLSKRESMPMKRTPGPLNFSRNSRKPRLEDLTEQPGEATPLTAKISPNEYSPVSPPDSGRSSVLPKHVAYIPHEYTPPSRNSFISNNPRDSGSFLHNSRRNSAVPNVVPAPPPRTSVAPTVLPPPPSHPPPRPSQPSSTVPPINTTVETAVTRNASNASRMSRFHAREPSISSVTRPRDASVGSTRRTRDLSAGRNRDPSVGRRARDNSVGRRARDGSVGRTRDGSAGRWRDGSVGRFRNRSKDRDEAPTPISISGPIVEVENRYEMDPGKKLRETLYMRGLGGTIAHDPNSKEMEERKSPESVSTVEQEMWPGNY